MDLMAAMPRIGVVMVLAGTVVAWRGIPEATAVAPSGGTEGAEAHLSISGTIGLPDGTPLEGVAVEGCGAKTRTAADGRYVLHALQSPPCVVTARAGTQSMQHRIPSERGVQVGNEPLDFTLTEAGLFANL